MKIYQKRGDPKVMENEEHKEKIILPEKTQIKILNFFLRTSIPRKIKQERTKKALSEKKGQEN